VSESGQDPFDGSLAGKRYKEPLVRVIGATSGEMITASEAITARLCRNPVDRQAQKPGRYRMPGFMVWNE
jgi:hypothetical protein